MAAKNEELVATPIREAWRSKEADSNWAVLKTECGATITGEFAAGQVVVGLAYRFVGRWETNPQYGLQFKCFGFVQETPHTEHGVVAYLTRFPGIGHITAKRLIELYGVEGAIGALRDFPDQCSSNIKSLHADKARAASQELKQEQKYQSTRVHLLDLLAGRGFPGKLIDACINKWGVSAAQKIRADPFCLIIEKMPGCGFLRVDQLYQDLGLPLDAIRRQVMVAWYAVKSDMSGSTWLPWGLVLREVQGLISGNVDARGALEKALEEQWLKGVKNGDGIVIMVADRKRAENEINLAEKLMGLL